MTLSITTEENVDPFAFRPLDFIERLLVLRHFVSRSKVELVVGSCEGKFVFNTTIEKITMNRPSKV